MKPQLLYLLWWDNGLNFNDHEETLLGIYGSEADREEAEKRYSTPEARKYWPFSRNEGRFAYETTEKGKDIFHDSIIREAARERRDGI